MQAFHCLRKRDMHLRVRWKMDIFTPQKRSGGLASLSEDHIIKRLEIALFYNADSPAQTDGL